MKLIEGVHASYVGPEAHGIRTGDRCFVLSDNQSIVHVRWTTGAREGEYSEVPPRDLVPDLVTATRDDEWAFEAGRGAPPSVINVQALYDRGGDVALFEAMEAEGHLDNLQWAALEAVRSVRASLAHDESWDQVRQALGQYAEEVERSAIIAAVTAAIESDEVLDESEPGDADGYID